MDTILLVSHVDPDGSLPKAALEALSAAKAVGAPVTAALFGPSVEKAAQALAGTGIAKVLAAEDGALAEPRYATDAAAATALAKASGASIVIAPATSRMARVMAGVAQRLGGRVDTHVTQIVNEGGPTVVRWYYRQRIEAKLLLVAGAGWTKKQPDGQPHPEKAEQLILGFLRASGASLGSSKSLVDQAGEGQKV